ncbi:hypothetical protein HPB49_007160 [Dermacentor silvarum]|uniref:Uncharacterized protein n=1 Tax=Dermacentor silvarum TaxID=543639 RepID=A0ACB8C2G9_DERSI|nr:hypothetical protein HPB49_007160 [Dermacentor silvarum]
MAGALQAVGVFYRNLLAQCSGCPSSLGFPQGHAYVCAAGDSPFPYPEEPTRQGVENFVAPSGLAPRKGHRRSACATALIPQSLGLELQQRYDAKVRAADIVEQWLAKRAAATQCRPGTTDSAANVRAPSGEVGNDLPSASPSPASLQPSEIIEAVMVELPVTSDEEEMDESTTRKRGRDGEDEEELPKQSKSLGAHSDSKRKPLTPPSTRGATELAPDAATSAEGPAATTPTAEKTWPSAAPGKPATTTPGVIASQKTAESYQSEPRQKAPPQTAAEFLKRNQRPATNVATKRKLQKTAKASALNRLAHPRLVPAHRKTPQQLPQQPPTAG